MDRNLVYQKQSVLVIDSGAIRENVNTLRSFVRGELIAVVKENGYGLGLEREYRLLKELGLGYYAVTAAREALALRELGCSEPILMLSPVYEIETCRALLRADIVFALGSEAQAALLKKAGKALGLTPRVHLKFETGMGRYGFRWDGLPDLKALTEGLKVEGCFTHLAGRPRNYEAQVKQQKERFLAAVSALEAQGIPAGMKHICNSAATMTFGDLGMDAVRVGSALVGKAASSKLAKLTPAVWLEAPVAELRRFRKGDTIGYQSTLTLDHDAELALVRVGHGDGAFLGYADTPEPGLFAAIRHAASVLLRPDRYKKYVELNGRRVPLAGRLGIAHMMLEVTGQKVKPGDMVKIPANPLLIHPAVPRRLL